jgi:hypothetical protein
MLYKNVEVTEINPVVYIKDKATESFKANEKYVLNKLVILGFNTFGVENPIDDLVYIYFQNKDWTKETELLSDVYKKLSGVFPEVKVNLHLNEFIEYVGNSVDLSLDEFLSILEQDDKSVLSDILHERLGREKINMLGICSMSKVENIKYQIYVDVEYPNGDKGCNLYQVNIENGEVEEI